MSKSGEGNLSRYVRRVMKHKGLTLRDIETRSGGEITDGYVADILRGAAENPSALKIKALARGLGVDVRGLFDVVCGPFEEASGKGKVEETLDALSFLGMMKEVAQSAELVKIVQESIELAPKERLVVLESLQSLNERRGEARRGKKSPRGRK